MNLFKSAQPYITEDEIPKDISIRLSQFAHIDLREGLKSSSGFALLSETERYIRISRRWLFKFVSESRKANAHSVKTLYQERLQKATENGRVLDEGEQLAILEQAEREMLKYAPINRQEVFILFDETAQLVWCSGSTVKKCEDALKRLRAALGTLKTVPLSFDNAGMAIASCLADAASNEPSIYQLPVYLRVSDYAKAVAVGADEEKATFDGVNLKEPSVRNMVREMEVRSLEMSLAERQPDDSFETVAGFSLHVSDAGAVSLKGLTYAGGQADKEGDLVHHYATEILIISSLLHEIVGGLRVLFGKTKRF